MNPDPPVLTCQMLGLQVGATTPSWAWLFKNKLLKETKDSQAWWHMLIIPAFGIKMGWRCSLEVECPWVPSLVPQ